MATLRGSLGDDAPEAAGGAVELGRAAGVDGLQVGAGAEHGTGVGEDADPDVVVGLHAVDGGLELFGDLTVDGVAGLRTVDGDDGDVAAGLVLDHRADGSLRRVPGRDDEGASDDEGRLCCPYCDSYEVDRLYLASLRVDSCVCASCV